MGFLGGMWGDFEDGVLGDGLILDEILPVVCGGNFFEVLDHLEGMEGLILRIFVEVGGDPWGHGELDMRGGAGFFKDFNFEQLDRFLGF